MNNTFNLGCGGKKNGCALPKKKKSIYFAGSKNSNGECKQSFGTKRKKNKYFLIFL